LQFTDFLQKLLFVSVCRTITVSVQPVQITTSLDISPVAKSPVIWYFYWERRKSWDMWDLFV